MMREFDNQRSLIRYTLNLLKILIHLACFGAVIYIIIYEIEKYYKNEDSSNIHMKRFGGHSWNSFPAITHCFQSGDYPLNEGLFNKTSIEEVLGISAATYRDTLLGKLESNKTNEIMKFEFERNTLNLGNYLKKFRIQDTNENEYIWEYDENWETPSFKYEVGQLFGFEEKREVTKNKVPLVPEYLDPKIKCFTHHPKLDNDISVDSIDFYYNVSKLESIEDGKMYMYVHQNKQFIRDMKYLYKLRHFTDVNRKNSNNQLVLDLMYIRIIQNREDAKEKCDDALENDDQEWMNQVVSYISCIPTYWSTVFLNNDNREICQLKPELEKLSRFLPFKNEYGKQIMFNKYKKPCQRMWVLANTNTDKYKKDGVLKIKFRFRYESLNLFDLV